MGILLFPLLITLKVDKELSWSWGSVFLPLFLFSSGCMCRGVRIRNTFRRDLTALHTTAHALFLLSEVATVIQLSASPSSRAPWSLVVGTPLAAAAALGVAFARKYYGAWNLVSGLTGAMYVSLGMAGVLVCAKLDGAQGIHWLGIALLLLDVPATLLFFWPLAWRRFIHSILVTVLSVGLNVQDRAVAGTHISIMLEASPAVARILGFVIFDVLCTVSATIITLAVKLMNPGSMTLGAALIPVWIGVPIFVLALAIWLFHVAYTLSQLERAAAAQAASPSPSSRGMSPENLDLIAPSFPYALDLEGEPETCVICIDDLQDGEDVRKLPCNHIYHSDCIMEWVSRNANCPTCRATLSVSPDSPVDAIPDSHTADLLEPDAPITAADPDAPITASTATSATSTTSTAPTLRFTFTPHPSLLSERAVDLSDSDREDALTPLL